MFSEQELLDCTYETMYPGYDGCGGGWYYDSFNYVKESARLAREANYPYRAADGDCKMGSVPNDLGTARLTSYVQVCFIDVLVESYLLTKLHISI